MGINSVGEEDTMILSKIFGWQNGIAVGLALCVLPPALWAQKRCDWHSPRATSGETVYRKCIPIDSLDGASLSTASNVTRIAKDGFSLCKDAFFVESGDADIVYLMDNSGSMWTGEDNNGYSSCAGDPFLMRDDIIKEGMALQQQLANQTSAGFVPFDANNQIQNNNLVEPLDLSERNPQSAANLQQIQSNVVTGTRNNQNDPCESNRDAYKKVSATRATAWSNPLKKVEEWVQSDPILSKSSNKAVVLVSDGAITDWQEVKRMALEGRVPPVYGIHLGYRLNRNGDPDVASRQLDTLSQLTGGRFYRVDPDDVNTMRQVMELIVRQVAANPLARKVTVTNQSLVPPQQSVSVALTANPDGSMGVVLDSVLGLQEGKNTLSMQVVLNDGTEKTYPITVSATGKDATRSGTNQTCYDTASLSLRDAAGQIPQIYSGGVSQYTVHLERSPSELNEVVVMAISADSATPMPANWGDRESILLGAPNMSLGFPIHEEDQAFNGRANRPTKNNDVLESNELGHVVLTWTHPRDPRETATFILYGKQIPVIPGLVAVVPGNPWGEGLTNLPPDLSRPIAILTPTGRCVSECGGWIGIESEPKSIPTIEVEVTAPFSFQFKIYDNLGHFVNEAEGEVTAEEYAALPKNGYNAKALISILPVSKSGRLIGSGVYIIRGVISTHGDRVTRNAEGEEVRVESKKKNLVQRVGYLRGNGI
jgi:hypothetical protein